jgi:hypothetical protein
MANYEKFVQGQGWVLDVAEAREAFQNAHVVEGVLRWKSNGRVPPADCVQDFLAAGCQGFDVAKSTAARDADLTAFVAEYKRNQRPASAEELFEMRAAFGPGAVVVDVLSGRRTKL